MATWLPVNSRGEASGQYYYFLSKMSMSTCIGQLREQGYVGKFRMMDCCLCLFASSTETSGSMG